MAYRPSRQISIGSFNLIWEFSEWLEHDFLEIWDFGKMSGIASLLGAMFGFGPSIAVFLVKGVLDMIVSHRAPLMWCTEVHTKPQITSVPCIRWHRKRIQRGSRWSLRMLSAKEIHSRSMQQIPQTVHALMRFLRCWWKFWTRKHKKKTRHSHKLLSESIVKLYSNINSTQELPATNCSA